jgi:hypothetical protein
VVDLGEEVVSVVDSAVAFDVVVTSSVEVVVAAGDVDVDLTVVDACEVVVASSASAAMAAPSMLMSQRAEGPSPSYRNPGFWLDGTA